MWILGQVQYIVDCRQLSKGMGHLIKYVRYLVTHLSPEISEADAKAFLLNKLELFHEERISFAADNIARFVSSTIRDNDVILTFGSSPLLRKVLVHAAATHKFKLVVVDSRPLCEGLRTLAALSSSVHCVYSPLSGAASAMCEATRVLLSASCFLSNGAMLAPAGTAMVAALAHSKQIPVVVACESYKFSEKVQLDSIVFNELGSASEIAVMTLDSSGAQVPVPQLQPGFRGMCTEIVGGGGAGGTGSGATYLSQDGGFGNASSSSSGGPASSMAGSGGGPGGGGNNKDSAASSSSHVEDPSSYIAIPSRPNDYGSAAAAVGAKLPYEVVNLRYDLTPINNISVVATESGLIPPTSIPVLIRELQSDFGDKH